jgi:hypothetical protein
MAEKSRWTWLKWGNRRKNAVRSHHAFRPIVEELAARIAPAAFHWSGGTSTAWALPANWAENAAPGNNDDVILMGGKPNDPVISANTTIGSLTTDDSWAATNKLTVSAGLTIQGDGANGHGLAASVWKTGILDVKVPNGGSAFLEVNGGHSFGFGGGSITSSATDANGKTVLGSVYVDGNSGSTNSSMNFTSAFSSILANVIIGKSQGGTETQHGNVTFAGTLNAPVILYGASVITVDQGAGLSLLNTPTGSFDGVALPNNPPNPSASIDVKGDNCSMTVTAPNASAMQLVPITQESGQLTITGRATIPSSTTAPGLQLSGGIFDLDPGSSGSTVTSDLKATGSVNWWNPSPSSGTVTNLLNGIVTWASSGYISVGDMGNNVGHFTNWVQLQCNGFFMTSGILNIGVGQAWSTGDKILVQGNISFNNADGSAGTATLAVYAGDPVNAPACHGVGNKQWFLKATSNGTFTGNFASVGPYTGSAWAPTAPAAWQLLEQNDQNNQNGIDYIYWN